MKPILASWLQSSADPSEVSQTVRGVIVGASSLIIFILAHLFGITFTPENVLTLATDVGMLIGAIWGLYGLIFKGVIKLGSVSSQPS